MSMTKTCVACGVSFDARSDLARYCSGRCSKRAQRAGLTRDAVVTPFPGTTTADSHDEPANATPLVRSVTDALTAAGQLDTWRGQQALHLAHQVHHPADTGSAKAALHRQLDIAMKAALPGSQTGDAINELEERVARKLTGHA